MTLKIVLRSRRLSKGHDPVRKLRDAPSLQLSQRVRRRCALFISCPNNLLRRTLVVGTSVEKCAPSADTSGKVQKSAEGAGEPPTRHAYARAVGKTLILHLVCVCLCIDVDKVFVCKCLCV